tara:strand:+ start:279 stop:485 length:207 start_codon:yes stop_codon:yes gene_type:complete
MGITTTVITTKVPAKPARSTLFQKESIILVYEYEFSHNYPLVPAGPIIKATSNKVVGIIAEPKSTPLV